MACATDRLGLSWGRWEAFIRRYLLRILHVQLGNAASA